MTTFSIAIWSFDVKPEFAEHERGRHLTGGSELDSALLRPRRGHFQRAVDAHPSNSNALFQLGMCALELGPLEMAIELMNKSCWSKFAVMGTAQSDHSPKMDGQIHKTTIFIKFCGSNDAPFLSPFPSHLQWLHWNSLRMFRMFAFCSQSIVGELRLAPGF
jgi:hypothetical protein